MPGGAGVHSAPLHHELIVTNRTVLPEAGKENECLTSPAAAMPVGTVRPPLYPVRIPTTDPPAVDVVRWRTPAGSACRTWSRNTGVPARISRPYLPRRTWPTRTRPQVAAAMVSRHAKAAAAPCRTLPGPPAPQPHRRVPSHLNTVCSRRAPDGRGPITTWHQLGQSSGRRRSRRPVRTPGTRHPRPTRVARSGCRNPAVPVRAAPDGQRVPPSPARPAVHTASLARTARPPRHPCRRYPPRTAGRTHRAEASQEPASHRPTVCHRVRAPPPAAVRQVARGTGSRKLPAPILA
jgi:hypothetical protein